MFELQKIKCIQWHGYAEKIAATVNFLGSIGASIKFLKFENKKLTFEISSPGNGKTFELTEKDVLVYSYQTGLQVVTSEIFYTFVKEIKENNGS